MEVPLTKYFKLNQHFHINILNFVDVLVLMQVYLKGIVTTQSIKIDTLPHIKNKSFT